MKINKPKIDKKKKTKKAMGRMKNDEMKLWPWNQPLESTRPPYDHFCLALVRQKNKGAIVADKRGSDKGGRI